MEHTPYNFCSSLWVLALIAVVIVTIGIRVSLTAKRVEAQTSPTPLPTYTFYPTYTPLPTYTPFPSPSPTATPTATPTLSLPPDLTLPTLEDLVTQHAVGSRYTHSSGSFSMDDLPSWDRHERGRYGDARVTLSNPWMSSFVEVAVNLWEGDQTTEGVAAWLSESKLEDLWGIYQSWTMIRYDDDGKRILADFNLTFRGLPFVGRIILMPSDEFLIQVTIVVPSNARPLLNTISDLLLPSIRIHAQTS